MKKIILITILLLFNTSFSQKKGLVYYGFIESFNLGNGRGQDANAYIVFNDKMSYYVTAKDSLENGESKYSEKVLFINLEFLSDGCVAVKSINNEIPNPLFSIFVVSL